MSKNIKSATSVMSRLATLKTSVEKLKTVIEAVATARLSTTPNDPAGARGYLGWQMGSRRLRDLHVGQDGWERDDTDQVPAIVNRGIGVRIAVMNTDDATCIDAVSPKNRSKKGPVTDKVADINQGTFIDVLDESIEQIHDHGKDESFVTYFLCVYQEGDDLRGELSLAVETSAGYIAKYDERIFIFGGESGLTEPVKKKSPDESDFDIPVRRRTKK